MRPLLRCDLSRSNTVTTMWIWASTAGVCSLDTKFKSSNTVIAVVIEQSVTYSLASDYKCNMLPHHRRHLSSLKFRYFNKQIQNIVQHQSISIQLTLQYICISNKTITQEIYLR